MIDGDSEYNDDILCRLCKVCFLSCQDPSKYTYSIRKIVFFLLKIYIYLFVIEPKSFSPVHTECNKCLNTTPKSL